MGILVACWQRVVKTTAKAERVREKKMCSKSKTYFLVNVVSVIILKRKQGFGLCFYCPFLSGKHHCFYLNKT